MSRHYSPEKLEAARLARNRILIENVRPAFEDFQNGMRKLLDGKARAPARYHDDLPVPALALARVITSGDVQKMVTKLVGAANRVDAWKTKRGLGDE